MREVRVKQINQIQVSGDVIVIPTEIKTMHDLLIYDKICGYKSIDWFDELAYMNAMGSFDMHDEPLIPVKIVSDRLGLHHNKEQPETIKIILPDKKKVEIDFTLNFLPAIWFEGLHEGDSAMFRIPYRVYVGKSKYAHIEVLMDLTLAQKKYDNYAVYGKSFEEHIFAMMHKFNLKHYGG